MIGYLGASSFERSAGGSLLWFKKGLAETGYIEDRNIRIEYRWADDQYERLPKLALELVRRRVAVLVAAGSPVALPAKAATSDIPVVFMIGSDPVEMGLVASFNHPGGNLTGFAYLNAEVAPKRLEFLHELVPAAKSIALLVNPANPVAAGAEAKQLQAVVSSLGLHLLVVNASNALQIEDAFAALVQDRVEALQIGVDPLFGNRRPACGSRRPPQSADHLPVARVHGGRRSHELRIEHSRRLPSNRDLHWADSERREACGAAGATTHQVEACVQSQSC